MNIILEGEESGQSRAPPRSRTRSRAPQSRAQSQSQNQEAQSAPPPPPMPTDFETRVKEIVEEANAASTLRIESEIQQLRAEYTSSSKGLAEVQDALKDELFEITGQVTKLHEIAEDHDIRLSNLSVSISTVNDKLDKLLKHFNIESSSTFGTTSAPHTTGPASGFSFPHAPSSSPPHTSSTPQTIPPTSTDTPVAETPTIPAPINESSVADLSVSEPLPATQTSPTPATELPPATVPYKSIIPSLSPKFDDAKGGEEQSWESLEIL